MAQKKRIEEFAKTIFNYSQLGKLIHYLQNRNNRNAVFIWIPKNAGTSIYKALKTKGCLKAKKVERVNHRFSQRGLVTFAHVDYFQLVKHGYISQSYDKSAFKFCFSRNPYDRAISLYEYFSPFKDKNIRNFPEFIQYISKNGVKPIGLFNSEGLSSCNPQVRWIENLNIHYCGSFEKLQEDFSKITKYLNLQGLSVPHLNKSVRTRIQEYYDLPTKHLVENFYQEDFEYFNYTYRSDDLLDLNQYRLKEQT